ncbi:hypothetical protein BGZ65_000796 [Modicella reniformis]|uniref:separase n=1 Tax=Modicella reniformis TaxID=1440133 RepID=A0A9P6MLK7_9FUNG|nr:hypothetical protein BGZ65_000796 [Modicella reniformis]
MGSKIIDKIEKVSGMEDTNDGTTAGSNTILLRCVGSVLSIIRMLSDITAGLWQQAQFVYLAYYNSDPKAAPNPTKLSCARVDAILLLFRLDQSDLIKITEAEPRPILTYLESAFALAKDMKDSESLPWISNALYNHGGVLFKTGRKKEAIRPLEDAVECYQHWLGDELSIDTSLHDQEPINMMGARNSTETRLVLANRYEVLGVCLQAMNDLDRALECFNAGLCALPLSTFRDIDAVATGGLKASQLPAGKLINRRVRIMFMMEKPRFESVVTSVKEFDSKMNQSGVPTQLPGIVQEFECSILSSLAVKTKHTGLRIRDQIEIKHHLMTRVYRGGRALTNPIRRARVLIQLAVLYQSDTNAGMQQEALHLTEEAIEILKEKDLRADTDLEPVRNHNLAMAYSWYGILDRCRSNGLSRKSKPFQIALQLWEMILSNVDCFVSREDIEFLDQRAIMDKVLRCLPEPELLYDHLQMLADCLGMNDYRVLQVQIYLLMLRLCNGVLAVSEEICADVVRIYARMGNAYLALGYSGKAKMALNQGRLVLEEMTRKAKDFYKFGDVYATWFLAYSLYLTSIGDKAQGVSAYNQARNYSNYHQPLISSRQGPCSTLLSNITLPRKVEAKVYRTLILAEASLARSQLLFYEGSLSEAIMDSKRAGRQLSRIVSTLSLAIKAAREDPGTLSQKPMENPFLIQKQESSNDQHGDEQSQGQLSYDNRQLQQGLELLATQRYQWLVVRLLIEAYHQLGRLYLLQGSAREAQYFVKEGKHIAQLSRAWKSMNRFMLEEAQLDLRRHEWESSQTILRNLIMQEEDYNAGALGWEIQDARIQLLCGDFHFATGEWNLSMEAYERTDEVLSHLMDKAFISGLEQLVIREPQTPREAKLVAVDRRQEIGRRNVFGLRSDGQGTPDQAQYECVTLGGIKAELSYRIALIIARCGRRTEAYGNLERAKNEDPMAFVIAEYHNTRAKVLMLELEETMAKHLVHAMIPDSALSVGLFTRTQTARLSPPPSLYNENSMSDEIGMSMMLQPAPGSLLSSPSIRVTRRTRQRRSRLSSELVLQNPSGPQQGIAAATESRQHSESTLIGHYHKLLTKAREQFSAAYRYSVRTYPPHLISDICSKQAYLCILESCFHQESSLDDSIDFAVAKDENSKSLWEMASRAACSLEMAKAITQHREMHGLIKQKLNPESVSDDNAWPQDIQLKEHNSLHQRRLERTSQKTGACYAIRQGSKIVNYIGLEKPRRLNLFEGAGDEQEGVGHEVEMDEEDDDLREVGMNQEDLKTRDGRQEYYNQRGRLHPSSSLGNERPFLEMLNMVYERDSVMMDEQPEAFQRDFVDILPDKWTVISLSMDVEHDVLYVNRLRARSMPLVVRLPLNRAQAREGDDQDLELPQGFNVKREREHGTPPLLFKEALKELQDILRESQDTLSLTSSKDDGSMAGSSISSSNLSDLPRKVKADWWARRKSLDDRLCALLDAIEDQWLSGLKGLIQSHNTSSNQENLLEFKRSLDWIMSQAINSITTFSSSLGIRAVSKAGGPLIQLDVHIDLCRIILHLGDQPSFTELKDLIHFLLDAYLYKNTTPSSAPSSATASGSVPIIPLETSVPSHPIVEYSEVQFDRIALHIKGALIHYWEVETKAKNNGFDDGAHVILILDKHLQVFPWESLPVLRPEAVSRVPSIWFLRDRILQQQYLSSKMTVGNTTSFFQTGSGDDMVEMVHHQAREQLWRDLEVDPQKTFYILNPAGDLKNTENEFKRYVKSQQGWDGVIGRAPMDMECINGLLQNDLYVYFGHSGGEQYVKSTQIRQLGRCAVSLLLGCSSGSLKGEGEFDPTGNAMNYLLAGCPTLVANLWDVTDKDLDRFSMAMFSLWGLEDNRRSSDNGSGVSLAKDVYPGVGEGGDGGVGDEMEGVEGMMEGEEVENTLNVRGLRLSLVEAVKEAREECRLKYLVGAASVVYGIPCYLNIRLSQEWPRLVVALVSLYGIYYAANTIYATSEQIQAVGLFAATNYQHPVTPFPSAASSDSIMPSMPVAFVSPQVKLTEDSRSINSHQGSADGIQHEFHQQDDDNDNNSFTFDTMRKTPQLDQIEMVNGLDMIDIDGHSEAAAIYTLLAISSLSVIDSTIGLIVVTRRSLRLTWVAFFIWFLRFVFRMLSLVTILFMMVVGVEFERNHLPLGLDLSSGGYRSISGASVSGGGGRGVGSRMIALTVLEAVVAAVHGWCLLVLIRDLRNQPRPKTVITRIWIWFCGSKYGSRLGLGHHAEDYYGGRSSSNEAASSFLGRRSGLHCTASSIRSVVVMASMPETTVPSRAPSICSFNEKV